MIPKNIKGLEWLKSFNMILDLEKTAATHLKLKHWLNHIQLMKMG